MCLFLVAEKSLKCGLEEKRKLYACGEGFYTLDDILTWPQYFKLNIEGIVCKELACGFFILSVHDCNFSCAIIIWNSLYMILCHLHLSTVSDTNYVTTLSRILLLTCLCQCVLTAFAEWLLQETRHT